MRLVLGSSSIWRANILRRLGVAFEVVSPDIDEKAIRDPDPFKMTKRIAVAKASAVLAQIEGEAVVVACDQVVIMNERVLEKPVDLEEARRFLEDYSLGSAFVVTAVAVVSTEEPIASDGLATARVLFKEIPPPAIEAALAEGLVLNSCGALVIEAPTMAPYIHSIIGDRDVVEGLPIALTRRLLAEFGYTLP